jgi:hypothetical protein
MFAMAYMGRKRRATRISCYAALTNDHVCGPGWPGPHEVHQRHQTRQEIRGKPTIAFANSTSESSLFHEETAATYHFTPLTLAHFLSGSTFRLRSTWPGSDTIPL